MLLTGRLDRAKRVHLSPNCNMISAGFQKTWNRSSCLANAEPNVACYRMANLRFFALRVGL
jgi:hypothetical protein